MLQEISTPPSQNSSKKGSKPKKGVKEVIDRKASWELLQAYIRDYNDQFDYDERNRRIRGGKLKTLECLYHDYMAERAKGTKVPVSMVETSMSLLARSTQQSPKTIARHIEFLLETGILKCTTRVNHWQNFMATLDMDFIVMVQISTETDVDKSKKAVDNPVNKSRTRPP